MNHTFNEKQLLGSNTAKNGFKNEHDVIDKFNNWQNDLDARYCLRKMGYELNEIEKVITIKLTGSFKTDIQVQVSIYLKDVIDAQNISIKLVSNPTGFNQADKRWIDKYVELWNMPESISTILRYYTGELDLKINNPRDNRRMFFDEFSLAEQQLIIDFFEKNRLLVLTDILKG